MGKKKVVRALTSPWINGFYNNLTQLLTSIKRRVAWENHIVYFWSCWQIYRSTFKKDQIYVCPANTMKLLPPGLTILAFRQHISSIDGVKNVQDITFHTTTTSLTMKLQAVDINEIWPESRWHYIFIFISILYIWI